MIQFLYLISTFKVGDLFLYDTELNLRNIGGCGINRKLLRPTLL